jgi:hypothetical protein
MGYVYRPVLKALLFEDRLNALLCKIVGLPRNVTFFEGGGWTVSVVRMQNIRT